jgi:hypothetical protein
MMDQLPAELTLHIITCKSLMRMEVIAQTNGGAVLEAHDICHLQLVSRSLFKITRDNELWKILCLTNSHSEAARKRREFLTGAPLLAQEPRVHELQRRAAALARGAASAGEPERDHADNQEPQLRDDPPKAISERARALVNWDPSYPSENVDWYGEYIARHAPLSMSWLKQPVDELHGSQDKREIRGLGMLRDGIDGKILAPLDDGSVCLWNIGRDNEAPGTKRGGIISRSRPGLLSVNGPQGPHESPSKAKMTSTGVVECVSVDAVRNKAYFAVQSSLNEVDLSTLQVTAHSRYPFSISALSSSSCPDPLTVGTTLSLHLHDPRLSTQILPCNTTRLDPPEEPSDFHRLLSGDPPPPYAPLFHPNPLSILHLPSHAIHVAGRFPSILTYDRRSFPTLQRTIHSGARLCSLASLPTPDAPTLVAAGEYNGKGSLELYPTSSPTTDTEPTRNRTSASRSKLLSATPHGTRLLFSDSDGALKWVERDGRTLVRRWNINPSNPSNTQPAAGIFTTCLDPSDVARKIMPIDSGGWPNREEIAIWTGERVGIVGFRAKARFEWVEKGDGEEGEGEIWAQRMRRALEREAGEVRWVRGLGAGVG